jgi:acetoin utilization deacetylase AcuC-like enzyme
MVFYSPTYVCSGYAFDTTRKAKWIADSLAGSPTPNIELVEPRSLTENQVAKVHDPDYVRAVQTGEPRDLAESQGFEWDAALWPAVLASNGGAVAAALAALEHGVAGSFSSGLHHARRRTGAGFCTFNGLVIAAREALAAGARAVLVLDLDAHCGGGTRSMTAGDPRIWQVDVSVSPYDRYDSSDQAWLEIVRDPALYLPAIDRLLNAVDRRGPRFDLCLYNAGMDPFETCSTGGLPGITKDVLARRERIVFEWCRERHLPVAFVLAGGYVSSGLDRAGLVELHRLTVSCAAEADCATRTQRYPV